MSEELFEILATDDWGWLATLDGEAIPEPSKIDDVAEDPAMAGAVAFLVSVDLGKTVRVNITAQEESDQCH